MEGIEGETEAARQQVDVPAAASPPSIDRRSNAQDTVTVEPVSIKPAKKRSGFLKGARGKIEQQDLFVEPAASVKKTVISKQKRTPTTRVRKGK
jgi:hypothetical protein